LHAVPLLTIHKSKGLEYNIVVFGWLDDARGEALLTIRSKRRPGSSWPSWVTSVILSKAAGRWRLPGITMVDNVRAGDGDVAGGRDRHPRVEAITMPGNIRRVITGRYEIDPAEGRIAQLERRSH
jgi:hypothetical protein